MGGGYSFSSSKQPSIEEYGRAIAIGRESRRDASRSISKHKLAPHANGDSISGVTSCTMTDGESDMPMDKLLKKLRCYDTVSPEEEQALRSVVLKEVQFRSGAVIVRSKTELSCSNLLLDGFVHRYKDLRRGARQTLQLAVPGDFLDLHSLLLKQLDHDIAAISECRLALFPHERLQELIGSHEHLGRLLWLSTVVDAAIHREWMLSLGARSAASRLAHLFCELYVRLEVANLAEGHSYYLPLTQADLGEILGITPVHTNRMLKDLRAEGLVSFRSKTVEITDWNGLVELGEFDPFYLSLHQRPR